MINKFKFLKYPNSNININTNIKINKKFTIINFNNFFKFSTSNSNSILEKYEVNTNKKYKKIKKK
jgi:hypothetical protein